MLTLPEVLPLTRPLLGVDLETTGTNPQYARIVELGLEIMIPGRPTKEYRTLVNPGVPIPPSATAVHGITDEMVRDAPAFAALADNLLKGFADADFAGYNVRFDLRMLAAEFKRSARPWDYEDACVIDAFRLWQVAEGRSLEHAVTRWLKGGPAATTTPEKDMPPPDRDGQAHNALWDIKMTTRVIAAQLTACAHLPRDLRALHELCSPGWFDAEGKLQWKDGALRFSFGEHRDKPLQEVPASYLRWVLGKDFSRKIKDVCREALAGRYPERAS